MAYPNYMAPNYGSYPNSFQPTYAPVQNATIQNVPQQANNGFACRPVTSKEEAMAVQVDFFGPGTVMPDIGHGVIYLKRFNSNTGSCDIFEFVAQQPKQEAPVQYVTKEEFDSLRAELEKLKGKKVKQNDSDE